MARKRGQFAGGPGVDGQPGVRALEVAVEHEGQRVLSVMILLGGGQRGALPCRAARSATATQLAVRQAPGEYP